MPSDKIRKPVAIVRIVVLLGEGLTGVNYKSMVEITALLYCFIYYSSNPVANCQAEHLAFYGLSKLRIFDCGQFIVG
jgi:hypothetical protein